MKKIALSTSIALLALGSTAHAGGESYENPGLAAYLAERPDLPPPPKLKFPFPQGVYFGVTGGAERLSSVKLENEFDREKPQINSRKTLTRAGASVGYLFREAGWFNQLEIEYMGRNKYTYEAKFRARPFRYRLGPEILNTHISVQTVMAKLYSTINIGHHIFPYGYLGIGGAYTKAPATLTRNICTGSKKKRRCRPQTIPLISTSNSNNSGSFNPFDNDLIFFDNTTVNNGQLILLDDTAPFFDNTRKTRNSRGSFAASAGVGVRFRLTYQFMVDLSYEFAYLGNTQSWGIPPRNRNFTANPLRVFKGSNLNSQSFNVSILFQPWGFAADVE